MSSDQTSLPPAGERPQRIIKRYSNRKLYDTKDSRYVTLAQIAELVRSGEDVQVIDNASKEDKTAATLALIMSEEVKTTPKAVPLNTLRALVHSGSEKILSQLREGPIGRLMGVPGSEGGEGGATEGIQEAAPSTPAEPAPVAAGGKTRLQELVESSKQTIDEWQAAIDERVRAILPNFFRDVQAEVKRLTQRVEELELRLKTVLEAQEKAGKAASPTAGEVAPRKKSDKE